MQAALFTMRCFETADTKFPFFVTSFIVYGTPELIVSTAERLFAGHLAACEKPCRRVHKTGPLTVDSFLRPESSGEEIDWPQVACRVEAEKTRRPLDEGVCCFSGPARPFQEQQFVRIEQVGQLVSVEFDPDIDKETLEQMEQNEEPFPLPPPEPPHFPKFLFIGSRWDDAPAQRSGNVLLVEASSLRKAADFCWPAFGTPQDSSILVEWCCPVHRAVPGH